MGACRPFSLRASSVAAQLQQFVNQRFRLFRRDAEVAAKGQRTFAGVEEGLLFFQRL
jgi:hypothetical protein